MFGNRQTLPKRRIIGIDVRAFRMPRHQQDPVTRFEKVSHIFKFHVAIIPFPFCARRAEDITAHNSRMAP